MKIRSIKNNEIFGDTIVDRVFRYQNNVQVISMSAIVRTNDGEMPLTPIANDNVFTFDLNGLNLEKGSKSLITYKAKLTFNEEIVDKTILIEELSIVSALGATGDVQSEFDINVEVGENVFDVSFSLAQIFLGSGQVLNNYELAVQNGFSGTLPEWLESLKGKDGKSLTFADLTPEQIESLKGKDGKSLTFEDLTPEQRELLKGERGESGKRDFHFITESFVTTSNIRQNVPNLSFAFKAGKRYSVELIGTYQTVALTTGGSVGFILSDGSAIINGFIRLAMNAVGASTALEAPIYSINSSNATVGSFLTTTAVSPINTPIHCYSKFVLFPLTDGVLNVQFGSEINTSEARLNSGTMLFVEEI